MLNILQEKDKHRVLLGYKNNIEHRKYHQYVYPLRYIYHFPHI